MSVFTLFFLWLVLSFLVFLFVCFSFSLPLCICIYVYIYVYIYIYIYICAGVCMCVCMCVILFVSLMVGRCFLMKVVQFVLMCLGIRAGEFVEAYLFLFLNGLVWIWLIQGLFHMFSIILFFLPFTPPLSSFCYVTLSLCVNELWVFIYVWVWVCTCTYTCVCVDVSVCLIACIIFSLSFYLVVC